MAPTLEPTEPGCGDLEGCIEFNGKDGKILDSITPSCLAPVEEG